MRKILIFSLLFSSVIGYTQSWESALQTGKSQLDIYWYESKPFIYGLDGEISGLEADLLNSFTNYIEQQYGVIIELNWIEANSFSDVIYKVQNANFSNQLGVSAFSITDQRKESVDFSYSYLSDVTVLVSSLGSPVIQEKQEIAAFLKGQTAITIEGTTYEYYLRELQRESGVDFEIKYISSNDNVLKVISETPNTFGFIDLSIYLIWLKNGTSLVRQNFFTIYGQGYGFLLPKGSDWERPFKEFFTHDSYKQKIAEIISKHLGSELYEFIDNLYQTDKGGTSLLEKEKEMQLVQLRNANLQLQKEANFRQFLLAVIVITFGFLVLLGLALVKIRYNNRLLKLTAAQIEAQQRNIEQKQEQLKLRNDKLIALHEEKDYLISILANDFKASLSRILGVTSAIMSGEQIEETDKSDLISFIDDSASRMNEIISKIPDKDDESEGPGYVIFQTVNIASLLSDIASRYSLEAEKSGLSLILKNCSDDLVMETDGLLLSLILETLVTNALKSSKPKTDVVLEVNYNTSGLLFMVSDTGSGYSPEEKQKIFSNPHILKKMDGKGPEVIGLSIVKKYVKDLGGVVWLESTQGVGSEFYVRFASDIGPFGKS